MTFPGGRLPLLITCLVAFAAQAQQNTPLTLAEAEDLALEQEPGTEALLERSHALAEQAVVAGQLPDPMLRIGLANYPIQSGGFSTEGMTQAQLGYRQNFPSGDSREFSTLKFESLSLEMSQNASARQRDVLSQVRSQWLDAYYWQQARAMVMEKRPFFSDLVEITRSWYAVGRKTQQDVLRAELELNRIDDRLIEIDRHYSQAVAALAEWTGPAASRPIAPKLPAWDSLPPLAVLQENLQAHPVLRGANARVSAHDAQVTVAEESKKPGWSIDVGYGYREGELPSGEPRSDFISVAVTTELPFFRKNRQDRALAAALSERGAARHELEQLRRRLSSELEAAYGRWNDLNRRAALYESSILVLSADHAQAALLAYQSDAGDFADVMRGYIDELNTRLDHLRLQIERAQSYAVLANLGGLPR
jgi:outer membrane protein TolC